MEGRVRENSFLFLGSTLRRGKSGVGANQRLFLADSAGPRVLQGDVNDTRVTSSYTSLLFIQMP